MRRLIIFLYLLIQRMATRLSHKPGMPREFALQCCRQLSGYLGKSPSTSRSSPESVSGGVNLYSVCVFVFACGVWDSVSTGLLDPVRRKLFTLGMADRGILPRYRGARAGICEA